MGKNCLVHELQPDLNQTSASRSFNSQGGNHLYNDAQSYKLSFGMHEQPSLQSPLHQ